MSVVLIVPHHTLGYPIAHGTASYEPYPDGAGRWLVEVPEEVAAHLLHVGGFAVAKKSTPATSAGLVAMRHPEGAGCSFAGRAYEPDADGVVMVPAAAVADLLAHGFVAIENPPAA